MLIKKIMVQLSRGLQARHTVKFIQRVYSFDSEITIIKNVKAVSGRSIMGTMDLAVKEGNSQTK